MRQITPIAFFVAALLFAGRGARADIYLPTEAIMEDQAANHMLLFYNSGVDKSAALTYDVQVASNGDFSYASTAGQTYLGQAFSLASAGIYNIVTGGYSLTSHGSLGATSWTVLGAATTQSFIDGSIVETFNYTYYDSSNVATSTLHAVNTIRFPILPLIPFPLLSFDVETIEDTSGTLPPETATSIGVLNANGTWTEIKTPDVFTGLSRLIGIITDGSRDGVFTVRPSTPEPGSVTLLAIGAIGLLAARRYGRRDRGELIGTSEPAPPSDRDTICRRADRM